MSDSGRSLCGSRLGLWLKAVLALYVIAAALTPFGHHDLACHIKSSTHCTTCAVGSSAEAATDPAGLARSRPLDAGTSLYDPATTPDAAVIRPTSGRAPPAIG